MYFWHFQQKQNPKKPLKPKGKVVSLLGFCSNFSETTPSSSWGNIVFILSVQLSLCHKNLFA